MIATITPTADTMSDNAGRRRRPLSFLVGHKSKKISFDDKLVKNAATSDPSRLSERTGSIQSDLDFVSTIDEDNSCLKVRTQEESLALNYYHHQHQNKQASVRFSRVEISTHYMILGDNPAVMSGAPLTISWESMEICEMSLDDYEKTKPIPREKHEMVVPRNVRASWLFRAGYARSDLVRAIRETQRIRRQREKSKRSCFFARR